MDYFDERYLDVYAATFAEGTDRTKQEVDAILEALELPAGAHILDLACGQGRHSVELASRGYEVIGLDYSKTLLEKAQQMAAKAGVDVRFVQGDMRDIPWSDRFDAVVNMFTAFGYFDDELDNQRVLHQAADALKAGGQFFIDVVNRDWLMSAYQVNEWYEVDELGLTVWVQRTFNPITGRNTVVERWMTEDGEQGERGHRVRVYNATALTQMLRKAGLRPTAYYGDFELYGLTRESRRLIVVSEKAQSG